MLDAALESWQKFESKCASSSRASDVLCSVAPNDSEVNVRRRDLQLQGDLVTADVKDALSSQKGTHELLSVAVDAYTGDLTEVEHKSEKYGGRANFVRVPEPRDVEVKDADRVESEVANPYKGGLSTTILARFDEAGEAKRLADLRAQLMLRPSVFDVSTAANRETQPSDPRSGGAGNDSVRRIAQPSLDLLVEARGMRFAHLDRLEPFFCAMFFFDVGTGAKLTETWYFDSNDEPLLALAGGGGGAAARETRAQRALFSLLQPSPDTYCVVMVYKVVSGAEIDATVEPYVKGVSNVDKFRDKTHPRLRRLGNYLQPFAYAFKQQDRLGEQSSFALRKARSNLSEQYLCELLGGGSGGDDDKTLPIELLCAVRRVRAKDVFAKEGNVLRPSNLRVAPFADDAPADKIVRQIASFPADYRAEEMRMCNDEYQNILFFRPLALNFNRHPNSSSRNIALRVAVLRSDHDAHALPEASASAPPSIFGRSSSPIYVSRQISSLTYHNTRPSWLGEEIKVRLPPDLQAHDHIVVLFSHVSCKDVVKQKKGAAAAASSSSAAAASSSATGAIDLAPFDGNIEQDLGFAALPLFEAGRVVRNGVYSVPVATQYLPNYLNPGVAPGAPGAQAMRYVDNGKPVFSYGVSVASSLLPQCDALALFFACASEPECAVDKLNNSMAALSTAVPSLMVQFFPIVFRLLQRVVVERGEKCAPAALVAMAKIVDTCNAQLPATASRHHRSHLVESFVSLDMSTRGAHEPTMRALLALLEGGAPPDAVLRHAWYAFDVSVKSMLLELSDARALGDSNGDRSARFSADYMALLERVVLACVGHVQRTAQSDVGEALNAHVALLLKDLLRVADRGRTASLVVRYASALDPASDNARLCALKMSALRAVADFEHFVPANLPRALAEPPLRADDVPRLRAATLEAHPLVGALLVEAHRCLGSRSASVRRSALRTLRWVMWKHAKDERYQSAEAQERIANMYFPLMLSVAEHRGVLQEAGRDEQRDCMTSVLHVLKHCSRAALLRVFWAHETQRSIIGFLEVLRAAVECFDNECQVREASFVVLDVLNAFMREMKAPLGARDSPYMRPAFDVITAMLEKPQTVYFLANAVRTLRWLVYTFARTIFEYNDPYYCGELCYHLLRHTNVPNGLLQGEAGALWWVLIQINHSVRRNFARVKLQSTIAISKLATGQTMDYGQLQRVLGFVKVQADATYGRTLGAELKDLSDRLDRVVQDSVRIAQFRSDPEMTCDLYYQVALGYQSSPDLRISRLENLAGYHASRQYWEEAAQCKFFMASLVLDYLKSVQQSDASKAASASSSAASSSSGGLELSVGGSPLIELSTPETSNDVLADMRLADLHRLSPALSGEPGLPNINAEQAGEEGIYQNKLFSVDGLWQLLRDTQSHLKRGSYFELAMEVSEFFVDKAQANRDYESLGAQFRQMNLLASAIESGERLFSRYYRVGFVGAGWGPQLDGAEYIYKEKNNVVFVQILKDRLIGQFGKKYGADKIRMLPNTVQLNTDAQRASARAELDPSLLYFQIISVQPYLDSAELGDRLTEWERSFDLGRFVYSVPFTTDGSKPSEDMSKQCTRKTILHTEKRFPYVKPRLLIVRREIVELQPIENATEMIQDKLGAIMLATADAHKAAKGLGRSTKEASNVLQQLLQGSVLTMVNAGPLHIATIFLSNASAYPKAHVDALRETMRQFIQVITAALAANALVISPELLPFHTECMSSFGTMKEQIQKLIDI
jgi:C2 domain in Dock180 and Zizimin proteins/DHR-2, Lobe C/DHR-2, Lobe B/DHR-2, Lobe A